MIVTCEGCETSFQLEDHKIKSTGSKVRCSKCRHVFTAYPPLTVEPEEPLILQEEVPAVAVSGDTAALDEIDFQLDALLREAAGEKADVSPIAPELDFLNVDDLLAGEAPATGELTAQKPDDDLHLDLDDLDQLGEAGKPATAEAAQPDEIQDAKFELDLDLEALASEGPGAIRGVKPDADLSALLESVDTGGKEKAIPLAGAMDEAELDFDLSLDETTSHQRQEARPSPVGEDELDLSDLESMLEGVEKGMASKPAATEELDLEIDLDSVATDETKSDEMQELDLTPIAGSTEKDAASVDAVAEELDFSGLAGILDEKAHAVDSTDTREAAEGIDLTFDDRPKSERVEAEPETSSPPEDDLMLDIEKLLEGDEEKESAPSEIEAGVAGETDLGFETESIRHSAGEMEIEIEPVADYDDFAGDQPAAAATPAAVAAVAAAGAAGAAALAAGSIKTTAEATTGGFTPAGMTGARDALETEASRPADSAEQKAKAVTRPGGIRKLLLAAAVFVVLAIAALLVPRGLGIHIPFLRDVEIPFFGKIFQAEPEDIMGNLKITAIPESISAEFTENAGAGRLCVIRGQVRNNYDHLRSFIRVTGKLYDKNKNVVKMTTVFAGNVLSKDELASQGIGAISARLKNRNGTNNLNVGVTPGAVIPFMIVFDSLPENIDEYSVEVGGSSN